MKGNLIEMSDEKCSTKILAIIPAKNQSTSRSDAKSKITD